MHTDPEWQVTKRYRCPQCDKRYAVVEWKKHPKCRQCGADLRAEDSQDKPIAKGQAGTS